MDHAHIIRSALQQVTDLRLQGRADDALGRAVVGIKAFQARRFRESYADLLESERFGGASHFFLDELYSESDYSERDAQFARIAGALTTVLPAAVANATLTLARVHALTEELDYEMARQWLRRKPGADAIDADGYAAIWRAVDRRADRQQQLDYVLEIGRQLVGFTRKPGLATMLRIMRGPAHKAGLASLQAFLESGFAVFGAMARNGNAANEFLETIAIREGAWIASMFSSSKK